MNNVIKLAAGAILLIFAACTKDSLVPNPSSSSSVEERAGTHNKFINILMYTKTAYDQHDAHSYAEGHILEFHTDWQSKKTENALAITGALSFVKHALQTGDTTGLSQHLFTYLLPWPKMASGYLDTYPDSALIFSGQSFIDFQSWFQTTCVNWLIANNCYDGGVVGINTGWYSMKIHSHLSTQ